MAATDLVLALTGASGSPYGVRLLEVLLQAGRTVHLTMSPAAVEVMQRELNRTVRLDRFELSDLLGDKADLGVPRRGRWCCRRCPRSTRCRGRCRTASIS